MESVILKVIADGRITIPRELRKEHQIHEGDFIEVKFIQKINRKGES